MFSITRLGLAAALTLAPASAVFAKDTVVAATWLPPQHQYSRYLYSYWAERVPVHAGDSVKVEIELGSARVTPMGNLQEIADGIVDASGHFAQYTPSDLPVANAVEELGMTFTDPRVMIAAATEFNAMDPAQQAEWADLGVVYTSSYATNLYVLICNKPIVTLEDMKGASLRLPGRAPAQWANEAGATTVSFNTNEQYGALDTGALTCTTTTAADAFVRNLHEVAKHITTLPVTLFWAGLGHGYNPDTWASLSVDARRGLLYANADAMAALIVEGTLQEEVAAREKLTALGVTFHEPGADLVAHIDAFRAAQPAAAVAIVRDTYKIADAEGLLARFQATVDKWTALLADVPVEDTETLANLIRTEIYDKLDLETYGLN